NDLLLLRLDARRSPVDLDNLAAHLRKAALEEIDPVADAIGVVEIDRQAGKDIEDDVAQGDTEHDADHAGRCPNADDRLAEFDPDNPGNREQEDDERQAVLQQARYRAADTMGNDALPKQAIDQADQQIGA